MGDENNSARNWGAGDEGGEESWSHAVRAAAPVRVEAGVNPSSLSFCFMAVCGVAITRYVLSSTWCNIGSCFQVASFFFDVVGGTNGDESLNGMCGIVDVLPGVRGSGLGVLEP